MSNIQVIPPNGGWGWVIVAGVALINIFNQSILSVFGLLFAEHLKSMEEETTAAALITNLNSLALNFSGFLIAPAIKTFSPRIVAFCGCLLTSSGLLLCALSTSLWQIIIGYSLFVGIGLGLISPSTFMAINSYFTTKRGRAVGIALAGTGLGQMFIPHMVRILLDSYGFRYTVFVMSGLALNGLLGALVFRPLETEVNETKQNTKDVKLLLDAKERRQDFQIKIVSEANYEIQNKQKSKTSKLCKKIFQRLARALDLELLMDKYFISLIVGIGLVYTSTLNFSMLFPYFLQFSVNQSRSNTAYCMSVLAFTDNFSRFLLPFLTDKLQSSYKMVFLIGTIGMLFARTLLAESTEFHLLIIYSGMFGLMKSATVINNNLTISEYCTPEKLPGGLGLNMISKGILVITVGQLLGVIRDLTKSYTLCLHAQNVLLLVVIVFWLIEFVYKSYRKRSDNVSIIVEEKDELKKLNNIV